MNKKSTVIIFLAAIVLFCSCKKEWEEPEFKIPVANMTANKTIADLKALHTIGTPPDSVLLTPPDKKFIIEAWVVSSDEGGNFYKSMVLQDHTGGIEMRIDKTGLYTEFSVGQKVFLDAEGLLIGDYFSYYQLGTLYEGGVGRINALQLSDYLFKDGMPDITAMPQPARITSSADLAANVGNLVTIPNCEFAAASIGKPIAFDHIDYTEHTVNFNGNSVILRTSSYAKFRNIICEDKRFTLNGILTVYNGTYQFSLRTKEDIDYTNSGEETPLHTLTFDENSLTSGGWRIADDNSATKWVFQNFGGNKYMFHAPVNEASARCDDWLISPEITLETLNGVSMYLDHQLLSGAALQDYYQVYYSTTDNGSTFHESDWTSFGYLAFTSENFELSNALDASVIGNNTFRIAIRFNKSADAVANRWSVRGVQFKK